MGGAMTALDSDRLQADESVGHAVGLKHTDETGNLRNALSQAAAAVASPSSWQAGQTRRAKERLAKVRLGV